MDVSQISAENCLDVLSRAKREGHRGAAERVYRFMSAHFLEVLRSPAVYGRLTAGERDAILARRMGGAPRLAAAEMSDSTERQRSPTETETGGRGRRVFGFLQEKNEWEVLTVLPEDVPSQGAGICTLYNYIFVAGGLSVRADGRSQASAAVFCFNPVTGLWGRVRPLSQPRSQLRLVSADGFVYAIGGECLFSVERYDPRADRWGPVATLPKGSFAVAHEAAACGGDLFVSGGSLFYRLLRYDPRRDEWEECPCNQSRRRSTDMEARGGTIYRFDVDRRRGAVDVFKYNTVVKVWLDGASFPLDRPLPFRCAVLGEHIYCVNREQTLLFQLGGQEGFSPQVLPPPAKARGALVPFVLCVQDTGTEDSPKAPPASEGEPGLS